MKSRILLLRHGQIQANVDGHWHGSTDSALTDFGVRQAKETGSFLEKNANIGKVFSSPLQRCLHTAHHASGFDLEDIETVPGFAEMSIGDWEGTPTNYSRKNMTSSTGARLMLIMRPPKANPSNRYLLGSKAH